VRLICMFDRALMLALIAPGFLIAQQPAADPPTAEQQAPASAGPVGPASPGWSKLTVKEKLRYDARHLFELDNIVFAGMGAALDQGRDRPGEWGQGWGSYFERYASHLGQYAIQRSIAFPVQAIDHEDTRYFRSTKTTLGGRVADAFLHTIWRHDDSGGMMPAYSEFFGDYGAAALSRYLWWPQRFHNGGAVFIAGSDTILIDAGINLFHEFTPDIKRKLHLGR
jgi:hypothetical protein